MCMKDTHHKPLSETVCRKQHFNIQLCKWCDEQQQHTSVTKILRSIGTETKEKKKLARSFSLARILMINFIDLSILAFINMLAKKVPIFMACIDR